MSRNSAIRRSSVELLRAAIGSTLLVETVGGNRHRHLASVGLNEAREHEHHPIANPRHDTDDEQKSEQAGHGRLKPARLPRGTRPKEKKLLPSTACLPPSGPPDVPTGTVGPWLDRAGKRDRKAVVRRRALCDVDPMSETAVKTLQSPEIATLLANLGTRSIVLVGMMGAGK